MQFKDLRIKQWARGYVQGWRILASIFYSFALLWLATACEKKAGGAAPGGPPPVAVQTINVKPIELPRMLSAVGSLESPQSTQLSSDFGGKIIFLDLPEGKEVQRGYVLARLDDGQSRAALSIAEARYNNAKKTADRLKQLHSDQLIAQQELDNAMATLQAAAGEFDNAKTALRKDSIRAPFTGVLGLKQVSLGAYVAPGAAVVRLTQTKPLHLIFSLPQRFVPQIKTGQTVRGVVGNCGQEFSAEVSAIEPYVDPDTRAVRIQATVANKDSRLLPGMSANVQLEVENIAGALVIPQEAVVRQGTKKLVYAVVKDGTVVTREVVLGQYFANQVQIESGLAPGDVVVAAGHQKLQPGAKVSPQPYKAIDNPNLSLGSGASPTGCKS